MVYGVMCGIAAVIEGLVRYVHRITSFLRRGERPLCNCVSVSGGFHAPGLAGASCLERRIAQQIGALGIGKTYSRVAPVPGLGVYAHAAEEACAFSRESGVVVNDYLVLLEIPFARAQDVCARILQHRHKEGEHYALGVKVLHRAVGGGALPFPAVRGLLEIAPVALPQGNMPPVQSLGIGLRSHPSHQRRSPRRVVVVRVLGGLAVKPKRRCGVIVQVMVPDVDISNCIAAVCAWEQGLKGGAEPVYVRLSPRIVAQLLAEIEIQHVGTPQYAIQFQFGLHGGALLKEYAQRVARFHEILLDGSLRICCTGNE